MNVPLVGRTGMASPRLMASPMRSPRLTGGVAAGLDPHSVQLSAYDGRLLLDRGSVPENDTFADDIEGEPMGRRWRRFHHTLVALAFFGTTLAYVLALLVLALSYGWRGHLYAWSAAVSGQLLLLGLGLALEVLLKHVHRRLREDGHLQVYRATKGLVRYPFRICAVTTAVYMLIGAWVDLTTWLVTPWPLLVGVAAGQAAVTAAWAAAYSLRVWQHSHGGQQWPDAETDLQHGWSAWDLTGRSGYFGRGPEKGSPQQAELIRYLHRQRDSLSRELLRLHTLLERRGGAGEPEGEAAAVRAGEVEAARAAEARAVASADLLRRENRSAMVLLDEKQLEVQRLETVQHQQEEENARLRGSLAEWSAANRRLERKLIQARAPPPD
mmetsp:Transcript_5338/g.15295  ORF Transcript_5338/g.15295 Transcript_5338/m.15295 type:complete len:383 (+) Transcript_5338:446-1594(+)|eukprot:CAMPEP_0206145854 /NCGR_PEP_ID=MMETSP1473-20131121/28688_1 /ASSEMBLY_ACC=CAM_ASM_001109 /TAXON_ID=1461547 /ORGANISM="Stichococcus sp, Strain RCC1054" /LENGTH=382 /DNA_ID=CAMNT_0053542221 /DNA_START=433 /DNA_END=1581 /DNA_ORIENTATION=-